MTNYSPLVNENSNFDPISPYAIAKLSSYHYTRMYRKSYNIFASNGILFNDNYPVNCGNHFTLEHIKNDYTNLQMNPIKKIDTLPIFR